MSGPSDFICFICFDIKICRLLNVEKKISMHWAASTFFCALSINEKVINVFFISRKRCVNTLYRFDVLM